MMNAKIAVIYLTCTLMVLVARNVQSAAINPTPANGSEIANQLKTENQQMEENSVFDDGSSEEVDDNEDDEMMMADDSFQSRNEMSSFFPQSSIGARYFKQKLSGSQEPVRRNMYSFGLGKRQVASRPTPSYNPGLYSFGLGKRSPVPSYNPGLYSFGLGKRNPTPAYNPGLYGFGLGKRLNQIGDRETSKKTNGGQPPASFSRFNFGLGKRSDASDNNEEESIDQYLSSLADEEEQQPIDELSMSKRTPPSQQQAAFFPAYIRSYSDINNGLMFPSGSRTNMFQTDRKPSSSSASLTFNKFPSIENYALMGKRLPVYNFGLGK